MILELLLLSPDPILISPPPQADPVPGGRPGRHQHEHVSPRAPPPEPQKQLVRLDDRSRLHIAILRTCKQLNQEGTALLYGKNSFVVGRTSTPLFPSPSPQPLLSNSPTTHPFLFVPSLLIHTYTPRLLDMMPFKTRGSSAAAVEDGFRAVGFFPWYLRLSTLAQIPSITFRKACHCDTWVILNNKEYKTDGEGTTQDVLLRLEARVAAPLPQRGQGHVPARQHTDPQCPASPPSSSGARGVSGSMGCTSRPDFSNE